jgi:hypothetical protein
MTNLIANTSLVFKARSAGFFWLVTFITGLSAMLIGGRFVVNGDAAGTATNILAHESAFRLGVTGNLVATVCYLAATLLVYEVLKPVNRTVSLGAAFFSLLGCGVGAVVFLFTIAPLILLGGASYLSVFTAEQLQALALASVGLGMRANDLSLVFFGCHILLVGYLLVTSRFVPRFIGLLLAIGGVCYLSYSFASFLAPAFTKSLFPFVLLPGFLAELLLSLWLVAKGVDTQRWNEQDASTVQIELDPLAT